MRALYLGIIAAIVIAVVVGLSLQMAQEPVEKRFAVPTSVRVGNG